jgi:drug/metabolite transporter (DMT)-like permease
MIRNIDVWARLIAHHDSCYTNRMHDILSYCLGIGCSICYGTATIFEQVAVRRHATIVSLQASQLLKILRQAPYIVGTILDLLGWLLFLLAARKLPLFLVLSFGALSLVVTAVAAHTYLGIKISRAHKLAILLIIGGTVLLGVAARPSSVPVHTVNIYFRFALETALIPLVLAGLALLKSSKNRYGPTFLALLAGLAFGTTGILARIIHVHTIDTHLIVKPLFLSLVAYGILGAVFLASALQRDNINRANSLLFASELTIPSLLGIIFLGDGVRHGLWAVMIIGFLASIIGTFVIAGTTKSLPRHAGSVPAA